MARRECGCTDTPRSATSMPLQRYTIYRMSSLLLTQWMYHIRRYSDPGHKRARLDKCHHDAYNSLANAALSRRPNNPESDGWWMWTFQTGSRTGARAEDVEDFPEQSLLSIDALSPGVRGLENCGTNMSPRSPSKGLYPNLHPTSRDRAEPIMQISSRNKYLYAAKAGKEERRERDYRRRWKTRISLHQLCKHDPAKTT